MIANGKWKENAEDMQSYLTILIKLHEHLYFD
jgi:hypothetical protein